MLPGPPGFVAVRAERDGKQLSMAFAFSVLMCVTGISPDYACLVARQTEEFKSWLASVNCPGAGLSPVSIMPGRRLEDRICLPNARFGSLDPLELTRCVCLAKLYSFAIDCFEACSAADAFISPRGNAYACML